MTEAGASPGFLSAAKDGVRVAVRVVPRASRDRILGIAPGAKGRSALKVAVTAAPEGGKANEALLRLLAKEWGVAKSGLSVALGASARDKVIHAAGDTRELARRIAARCGAG